MKARNRAPIVLTLSLTLLAACGGGEDRAGRSAATAGGAAAAPNPMDTTPEGTPAPPAPGTVTESLERNVTARLTEWAIGLSRDTVPAGDISIQVMNAGTRPHALEVEGRGIERETQLITPGGTTTLTVRLEPGTYEVYCPVDEEGPDHDERGMRATLVVTPA